MNLYSVLEKGFPKDKTACAIETHDGLYYSWDDLEHATAKMANLLKSLKLPAGSRVEVQVEKSPEALFYIWLLFAGMYISLSTLPIRLQKCSTLLKMLSLRSLCVAVKICLGYRR